MRYTPYGITRSGDVPTDFRFTGQRAEGFGLYDYGVRFYSPGLGRFVSADTVVPGAGNPQALNRYAYAVGNPLKYTDPSGHRPWEGPPTPTPERPPTPPSSSQRPTPTPIPSTWVGELSWLLKFYQSQGEGTNDCGPTNLAMVLNLINGEEEWTKDDERLKQVLWRLPFPQSARGATPPGSMARAFNRIAEAESITWRATQVSGSREALLHHLQDQEPVTILLIYGESGAHYVTIVGYEYSREGGDFYALDPSPEFENNPGLAKYTWAMLESDWARQPWWAVLMGYHKEMITYTFVTPDPLTPSPIPVPTP